MRRTVGIGVSLVLVLSLAIAAYVVYNWQIAGGPTSGATGAGSMVLLDIEELILESDLVVLGTVASNETFSKTVSDTTPLEVSDTTPLEEVEDYVIELERVSFTVEEYLKGSGGDTVTITTSPRDDQAPDWSENTLDGGTKYVVFLFDPSLLTDDDFWGDTYLTLGTQGIWQVSGNEAERRYPSKILTLESLRSEVSDASGR